LGTPPPHPAPGQGIKGSPPPTIGPSCASTSASSSSTARASPPSSPSRPGPSPRQDTGSDPVAAQGRFDDSPPTPAFRVAHVQHALLWQVCTCERSRVEERRGEDGVLQPLPIPAPHQTTLSPRCLLGRRGIAVISRDYFPQWKSERGGGRDSSSRTQQASSFCQNIFSI